MQKTDILIIGSGISALQLARQLNQDFNVTILTKTSLEASNSYRAQGGIAAAIYPSDSPEKHWQDTLEAGRYHNDSPAVRALTEEAPFLIQGLLSQGCPFDRDKNGNLLLGLEGAHTEKRIVHGGGDATGKIMIEFLKQQLNGNIDIYENMFVYEVLIVNGRCAGVKVKDGAGKMITFTAPHVVIATGGCGQLYSYTSNVENVTGDGIALAYLAGAEIADMEFIQFHPTILYKDGKTCGLISEAVRGEGAQLINEYGETFMKDIHPLGDLAPRHLVSQAIYQQLRKGRQVYLDISSVEDFPDRFPTIFQICAENGIDVKQNRIPVVPGSHFLMGGIKTDLNGQSSISGLYAIGEAACTGIHGANRLASNSLLEGLFVGKRLANLLNSDKAIHSSEQLFAYDYVPKKRADHRELPTLKDIQSMMMENVGIVRNHLGLTKQMQWLEQYSVNDWLDESLDDVSVNVLSRIFMLITASMITQSALEREESRGGHYRDDFPCENNHLWKQKQIILSRKLMEEENEPIKIKTAT